MSNPIEVGGSSLRSSLISMGYNESKPGVWIKPIGYQAFVFIESTLEYRNYFKNNLGNIDIWESKHLSTDFKYFGSFIKQLKHVEAYTRIDLAIDHDSEFQINGDIYE